MHIHLQRATTKHHRKIISLNLRTTRWTQIVNRYGQNEFWSFLFDLLTSFPYARFYPTRKIKVLSPPRRGVKLLAPSYPEAVPAGFVAAVAAIASALICTFFRRRRFRLTTSACAASTTIG